MILLMKERVTISVEPEALAVAREDVKQGRAPNLSAAVENALLRQRRSLALREALDLWEDEYGPITEEAKAWARKELERAWGELSSLTQER
jgi:Arc/MetJ-type ribon-helix-helix transcriptional regulator